VLLRMQIRKFRRNKVNYSNSSSITINNLRVKSAICQGLGSFYQGRYKIAIMNRWRRITLNVIFAKRTLKIAIRIKLILLNILRKNERLVEIIRNNRRENKKWKMEMRMVRSRRIL